MDIIERVILSDALATIPTEHLKSNQPHSLAPTQPMMYAREPDVITVELKVTTRIRSFMRGNSGVALNGAGVKTTSL